MHHELIDHFSFIESSIHRLDPRAKIIALFLLIVITVLTPIQEIGKFIFYFLFLMILIGLSKVPVGYLLKHSLLIIPFVFMVGVFLPFMRSGEVLWSIPCSFIKLEVTKEGLCVFASVLVKSFLSVLSMLLLASTTKFSNLLKGLELLKTPRLMIIMLSFLYRYIFILIDEAERMKRARDCRSFGHGGWYQLKVVGSMVGVLLIRTYERAERIYAAMASRGFDGEIRTLSQLRFRRSDIAFIGLSCLYISTIWIAGKVI